MPPSSEQNILGGRRARDTRDPLIGALLDDRFLIEARIATGAFGAIYRARTADGEPVALKILHPWLTGDPNMVARFRREGATLTQLHDPHTVTTLAVGETGDGLLYIAMELLSGESLHDRLHRAGALPWQTAIAIARAVCSSLAEAHARGVVHRDLKPANIQIETRGDDPELVKVLDFGIVKIERGSLIDDGKELTYAGHMIGTYDYMSPEQIVGDTCRDASDIYSLGLVIYEMLTGHRPFVNVSSPASMMAAMLTQMPVPPSVLVATPPALDRIVMRCLQREPEDRFADIRQLAAALDRVLELYYTQRDEVTVERPVYDPLKTIVDDQVWGAETGEVPWAMPQVNTRGEPPAAPRRSALKTSRTRTGPGGPSPTRCRSTRSRRRCCAPERCSSSRGRRTTRTTTRPERRATARSCGIPRGPTRPAWSPSKSPTTSFAAERSSSPTGARSRSADRPTTRSPARPAPRFSIRRARSSSNRRAWPPGAGTAPRPLWATGASWRFQV
jgi:serine/threonine-protein kinase